MRINAGRRGASRTASSAVALVILGLLALTAPGGALGAYFPQGTTVVMEAENADQVVARGGRTWQATTVAGAVGGARAVTPDTGLVAGAANVGSQAPELRFTVTFPQAGTYRVAVRGRPPNGAADSLHVGLDGVLGTTADAISGFPTFTGWSWAAASDGGPNPATVTVPAPGVHTVNVWAREDGLVLDRIVLAPTGSATPTGDGPAESPRAPAADTTPPTVTARMPGPGAGGVAADANVVVTFSEPVAPASVTATTAALARAGVAVAATRALSADGRTLTIDPSAAMAAGALHDVRVAGITDVAGNAIAAPVAWSFTTAAAPASGAWLPVGTTVVMEAENAQVVDRAGTGWRPVATPAGAVGGAMAVPDAGGAWSNISTAPTAAPELRFPVSFPQAGTWKVWVRSNPKDSNGDSVHVAIDGAVTTTSDQVNSTSYGSWVWMTYSAQGPSPSTVVVPSPGVHTLSVLAREDGIVVDRVHATLTGAAPSGTGGAESARAGSDTTGPAVTARTPAPGATAVPVADPVTVTFDEPVAAASVTAASARLLQAGSDVPATRTLSADARTLTIDPAAELSGLAVHSVALSGITDVAGNALAGAPVGWSFTTGPAPDRTAPEITGRDPAPGATGVATGAAVTVAFSEPIAPASVTAASVRLLAGGDEVAVARSLSADGLTLTIDPVGDLAPGALHTVSAGPGITDLAGNPLGSTAGSWTFTTESPPPAGPAVLIRTPPPGAELIPLDARVQVTFTDPVDPATVEAGAGLSADGVPVPALRTLSADGLSLEIVPTAPLAPGATVTVTLGEDLTDAAGRPIQGAPVSWAFTTDDGRDRVAPAVASRTPGPGAARVDVGGNVTVLFSEPLDPATVTAASVALTRAGTPVPAAVALSPDGTAVTVDPDGDLVAGATHRVTLGNGLADLAGNGLAGAPVTWTFSTIDVDDTTPPSVVSRSPAPGATGVPLDANVVVGLSEPVDPATLGDGVHLEAGGVHVDASASLSDDGLTLTVDPDADLTPEARYSVSVGGSLADLSGNPLAQADEWEFTASAVDRVAPAVESRTPPPGAVGVAAGTDIVVTFSEPVAPATISPATVVLSRGATTLAASRTLSADGLTLTIDPDADLRAGTLHGVTLGAAIADPAGNALGGAPLTWSFRTAQPGTLAGVDLASSVGIVSTSGTQGENCVWDYDEDGIRDLLISTHGSGSWLLMRGRADDTFVRDANWNHPADDRHGCAVGDFGGVAADGALTGPDGLPDVFMAIGACQGTCTKPYPKNLWLQRRSGSTITWHNAATAFGIADERGRGREPITLDYDRDGRDDLYLGNDVGVLYPSPNRLFRQAPPGFTQPVGSGVQEEIGNVCVATGDIDADGWTDLVSCGANVLRVYANQGGAGFVDVRQARGFPGFARDVELADVTGDGAPDAITVEQRILRLRVNEGGSFSGDDFTIALGEGRDLAVGDANGDGRPDLYVVQGKNSQFADLLLVNGGPDGAGGWRFSSVAIPQTTVGDGDTAQAIDDWAGSGRAAFLVTNGKWGASGPVQMIFLEAQS